MSRARSGSRVCGEMGGLIFCATAQKSPCLCITIVVIAWKKAVQGWTHLDSCLFYQNLLFEREGPPQSHLVFVVATPS
jgi:hypothetical protein